MLTLGTTKFQIQSIARAADGSVVVPPDRSDVAYWVEGTNINYVFALSPTSNSLALKDVLKQNDVAKIVWADCGADEYVVKSIEAGVPDQSTFYDQSVGGVTIFVQNSSTSEGLTITGGRPEVKSVETPGPTDENEIQADISFLGDTTSPDGKTIRIGVSILNRGTGPISTACPAQARQVVCEERPTNRYYCLLASLDPSMTKGDRYGLPLRSMRVHHGTRSVVPPQVISTSPL